MLPKSPDCDTFRRFASASPNNVREGPDVLRLLADENFNSDIFRGLLLRKPSLDAIRAQDVPLFGATDQDVLAWAAAPDRIILTHDRATMPRFAYERLAAGQPMPGLFVLDGRPPMGQAIEELLLMHECSRHEEWNQHVVFVPL